MYKRKAVPYGGLNVTKVCIGSFLGQEKDEDAYVVLSEPSVRLAGKLKHLGEDEALETFTEMLPDLIVEHNLYEDDEVLMSKSDVAELIGGKISLALHVLKGFTQGLFPSLPKGTGEK